MDKENFNRKNVKRFERQAKRTVGKNLVISTVEGIGLTHNAPSFINSIIWSFLPFCNIR